MTKIFPYLTPATARRLQFTAADRVVKVRSVVEAAISAYSEALSAEGDTLQEPTKRHRTSAALDAARTLVKNRTKRGLVKIGTAISTESFTVLRQIQGSERFLSDTVELVLSYYLWQAPERRSARDDFSGFLWPPIDLPGDFNVYHFVKNVTESE